VSTLFYSATKPTWREAWKNRRCILALNAFFERHEGVRYQFSPRQGGLFVVAGLWEAVEGTGYFTVLTAKACPLVAEVHPKQRMPVILEDEQVDPWMADGVVDGAVGDEGLVREVVE
jgi:putative SOS response-associated peptidase YedK